MVLDGAGGASPYLGGHHEAETAGLEQFSSHPLIHVPLAALPNRRFVL